MDVLVEEKGKKKHFHASSDMDKPLHQYRQSQNCM